MQTRHKEMMLKKGNNLDKESLAYVSAKNNSLKRHRPLDQFHFEEDFGAYLKKVHFLFTLEGLEKQKKI